MDQAGPREELSERLETARLRLRLTKEQLRARAGLGRTTISNALNGTGPLPSKETITALARALGLEDGPLLGLRRKAADPPGQIGTGAAPESAPLEDQDPDLSTAVANTILGDLSHSTLIQARTATISITDPPAPAARPVPGRPIGECDPHDLEMRVAGEPPESPTATVRVPQRDTARLPGYVRRDHDDELDRAVEAAMGGSSRMVVLVGSSSTGKTRACWEAVQPLAEHGWRLWHPFDPTRAEAALEDLGRVIPYTVVWLNESQHYLAHPRFGERVAAALHTLLTDPDRGPVLVLGTLWKKYSDALTAQPAPEQEDTHAQARALLEGRRITVPVAFTEDQLEDARKLARSGDGQLAHALDHVRDGRLAQTLAGAPELVHRYETASPGARALLNAAMDARRLGVGLHLPLDFLVQAAEDYLTDDELDALPDQWVDQALEEAGTAVHGGQAPLRRIRIRRSDQTTSTAQGAVYRLEDYLEQHANHTRREKCPPASFWHAADEHLTDPDDLYVLAKAARNRGLLWHAVRLSQRAIVALHPQAAHLTAELLSPDTDPDRHGVGWIAAHADVANLPDIGSLLARLRDRDPDHAAKVLASRAVDHTDPTDPRGVAVLLAELREAGQDQAVTTLASRAVDHTDPTNPHGVAHLLTELHKAGQDQAVTTLASRAVDHTDPTDPRGVAVLLAELREAGQDQAVTTLASRAVDHTDHTNPHGVAHLLAELHKAGQDQAVTTLASRAVDHTDHTTPHGVAVLLAELREAEQDQAAERLASRVADLNDPSGVAFLLTQLRRAGQDQAERLVSRAVAQTDPSGIVFLLTQLRRAGQDQAADRFASRVADLNDPSDVANLLKQLRRAGQDQAAERLASRVADHTDPTDPSRVAVLLAELHEAGLVQVVTTLASRAAKLTDPTDPSRVANLLRELREAGQDQAAAALERRALDAGALDELPSSLFPYGRHPDGSPAGRWTWEEPGPRP